MTTTLKTPLNDLHRGLKARFVSYGGYEMPLQYPDGVLQEHKHTRASCGVFDVSHMGQIRISSVSESLEDLAIAIESLMPADLVSLGENRQCYSFLTNMNGGIVDDLMITKRADHFFLVSNASRKNLVLEHQCYDKIAATCDRF